jgi:hypothetical protein
MSSSAWLNHLVLGHPTSLFTLYFNFIALLSILVLVIFFYMPGYCEQKSDGTIHTVGWVMSNRDDAQCWKLRMPSRNPGSSGQWGSSEAVTCATGWHCISVIFSKQWCFLREVNAALCLVQVLCSKFSFQNRHFQSIFVSTVNITENLGKLKWL